MGSPFDLDDSAAYARWRSEKLATVPGALADLRVEVHDPQALTAAERSALLSRCARFNMAIYVSSKGSADKEIPRLLGLQLGLRTLDSNYLADEDGISALTVAGTAAGARREFIPYTDRAINWHTDGYYNSPERTVRGMILHCVASAEAGGENRLLDHELAYLSLRDENPEFIRALSEPGAMIIPARIDPDGAGEVARPDQAGPVFSVDESGFLHMRYTARTRSIVWKGNAITRSALASLEGILKRGLPWIVHGRLEPGMGLVCNNVLHDRTAFSDSSSRRRLIYRARFYERISTPA